MARPMAITRTIRKEPVYIGFFKFFIKKRQQTYWLVDNIVV